MRLTFIFQQIASTGLLHDKALILISTISGSLVAVEQKTGDIRWKLANGIYITLYYLLSAFIEHTFLVLSVEPAVKVPVDKEKALAS